MGPRAHRLLLRSSTLRARVTIAMRDGAGTLLPANASVTLRLATTRTRR
jgi:hypothetical protein